MPQLNNRRELEQFLRQEGRLPPGQSLTLKFPVLHYGVVPEFDPETWRFKIWGEVIEKRSWTWEEFQELPQREITLDIHCVTRWSKFDTAWKGVAIKDLIEKGLLGIKPEAAHVLQHAAGGYTCNLPLELVLQDKFLMATHFELKIEKSRIKY